MQKKCLLLPCHISKVHCCCIHTCQNPNFTSIKTAHSIFKQFLFLNVVLFYSQNFFQVFFKSPMHINQVDFFSKKKCIAHWHFKENEPLQPCNSFITHNSPKYVLIGKKCATKIDHKIILKYNLIFFICDSKIPSLVLQKT